MHLLYIKRLIQNTLLIVGHIDTLTGFQSLWRQTNK